MDSGNPEAPEVLTGEELPAGSATEFLRPSAKENAGLFVQNLLKMSGWRQQNAKSIRGTLCQSAGPSLLPDPRGKVPIVLCVIRQGALWVDQLHARAHGLEAPLGPATCTAVLSRPPRAGGLDEAQKEAAQEWFSREAASFQSILSHRQPPLWMSAVCFPHSGIHNFLLSEAGVGALGANSLWAFGQIASQLGTSVFSASALQWLLSHCECPHGGPQGLAGPPFSLTTAPRAGHTPTSCPSKFILTSGPLHWLSPPPDSLPHPHTLSAHNQLLLFSLAFS